MTYIVTTTKDIQYGTQDRFIVNKTGIRIHMNKHHLPVSPSECRTHVLDAQSGKVDSSFSYTYFPNAFVETPYEGVSKTFRSES